jgi:MFS transporter, DHA2 family, multidrug resistance protein
MGDTRAQYSYLPIAESGEKVAATVADVSVRRRWAVLLAVSLVTAVEICNRVSVNVILPDMQGNVAANSDQISWVITLYNSGFISSMALSAGMRRVLGARRHFLVSIALYAVGAVGCFLSAHSLSLLLVSRVVMGFGGGSFLVRYVVLAAAFFPGPSAKRPMTAATIILLGLQLFYPWTMGWMDDRWHWNYAFLIDFPFLLVGTYVIWKYMPPGHLFEREQQKKLDYWGTFLLIASVFALQSVLSRGEQDLWLQSPWIVAGLVIGIICLVLFLLWELHPRNDSPVLHLRQVLDTQSLRASFGLVMVLGALMGTVLFILPQYLRNVQSFSATQTGGIFGCYCAGLFCGGLLSLRIFLPKLGGLYAALLGFSLLLVCYVTSIDLWTPDTPTYVLVLIMFGQGFAIGPMWFSVANLAVGQVALPRLSEAEATYYFVRQMGNSFGVSAASVLFDRRLTLHSSRLLDTANRLDPATARFLRAVGTTVAKNTGGSTHPDWGALQIFQQLVGVQSRLLAFVDISYFLAIVCAVGVFLVLLTREEVRRALHHHIHLW